MSNDIASIIRQAVSEPKGLPIAQAINVEKAFLQPIKKMLQNARNNSSIDAETFHYLAVELRNKSGIVRLRALDVMDYIFMRSCTFRDVVAQNIKTVAKAAGIIRIEMAQPNAENFTADIEERFKGMIELWDHLYGVKYPSIHVMGRFCRESLKLKMPNIVVNVALI